MRGLNPMVLGIFLSQITRDAPRHCVSSLREDDRKLESIYIPIILAHWDWGGAKITGGGLQTPICGNGNAPSDDMLRTQY